MCVCVCLCECMYVCILIMMNYGIMWPTAYIECSGTYSGSHPELKEQLILWLPPCKVALKWMRKAIICSVLPGRLMYKLSLVSISPRHTVGDFGEYMWWWTPQKKKYSAISISIHEEFPFLVHVLSLKNCCQFLLDLHSIQIYYCFVNFSMTPVLWP